MPLTDEELAAVSSPATDPELDEVEPASIDEAPDLETPFEKLLAKSRRLSDERVRHVLESLLFVSDRALSIDQLYESTGIERERITRALEELRGLRAEGSGGVTLGEVDGGWQLRTVPEASEYVRRFLRVKPQRLTRAALETLAIVAYRQPVTRPEIEDIRGVDCGAVIKALLERRLVKILGKKEEVGRPILYGSTREFLEFFGLRDLASLPTLREFQELSEEHQEIVEKETAPPPEGTVEALADTGFAQRLGERDAESEQALDELEQAISSADKTAKESDAALGVGKAEPGAPLPDGEPPSPAS